MAQVNDLVEDLVNRLAALLKGAWLQAKRPPRPHDLFSSNELDTAANIYERHGYGAVHQYLIGREREGGSALLVGAVEMINDCPEALDQKMRIYVLKKLNPLLNFALQRNPGTPPRPPASGPAPVRR